MQKLMPPLTIAALLALGFTGCGQSASHDDHVTVHDHHDGHKHDKHGHDGHGHDAAGPHGGTIIELGDDSYHAELLHDDASHAVTVYLLDGTAQRSAPAGDLPQHVLLNVMIAEAPRQYSLPRVEDNRYSVTDERLCESLCDSDDARARLNATIGGKTFVGNIEPHAHDGHEHGHAHAHGNDVR